MSWWNGVSTCFPLGVDDCVVWWDAWVVVVAVATLLVSSVSAAAVAYLGWQANKQSKSAYASAQNLADAENNRRTAESARHERVILTYVESDLDSIEMWARGVLERLNDVDEPEYDRYIRDVELRKAEVDKVGQVQVEKLCEMLPSFHHCSAEIAARLARAVGCLAVVRMQLERNATWANVKEDSQASRDIWHVVYKLMCKRIRLLHEDGTVCGRKARMYLHNLDI